VLNDSKRPTIQNIKKKLNIRNKTKDDIIDYYLHIWEQRHAPTYIEDINTPTELTKQDAKKFSSEKKLVEHTIQLESSLSMMRATIEAAADSILMLDKEGKLQGWNQKFVDLFKMPKSVLKSKDETTAINYAFGQIVDPTELANLVREKYTNPVEGYCGEMYFKNGRVVERYYQPQVVNGEVIGHVWSLRDITQRKDYEKDLKLKQRAIDSSPHGVVITKREKDKLIMIDANPAFSNITGIKKKELIKKNLITFIKQHSKSFAIDALKMGVKEEKNTTCELCIRKKGKDSVWCELYLSPVKNESNEIDHFVCILVDISDRKTLEAELLQKATHDFLTELPNRTLILARILHSIKTAQRSKTRFAVFFLDLDEFKLTNDGYGHNTGDELLKLVGDRLKSKMRDIDIIGRLGGDEFFVISRFFSEKNAPLAVASRLLDVFSEPFKANGQLLSITASIGGCVYPDDGKKVETLMQNADIAMYQAKSCGRNTFKFFRKGMNELFLTRLTITNYLRDAIQKNKMFVMYQPIINLRTNQVSSVEALVRFRDFEKQLPSTTIRDVIDIAEESGLINTIGEFVIEESCHEINKLCAKTNTKLKLSINISNIQIKTSNFSRKIKKLIEKSGFPKNQVELELTESVLMTTSQNGSNFLNDMKSEGISFSLDDFGTGYSNLSYLYKFPISKLKIDKSFVAEISKNSVQSSLIKVMISMAKVLGMKVVAEGVETKIQYDYLKKIGCDEIQGYYMSKPLTAADLLVFLNKNK